MWHISGKFRYRRNLLLAETIEGPRSGALLEFVLEAIQIYLECVEELNTNDLLQRDVKSRTKQDSQQNAKKRLISVTVPIERPSINLLATPKGMIPNRGALFLWASSFFAVSSFLKITARTKVSYTPHRGAVTFVDTTKLSDREFELAVANGLIKARSGRCVRIAWKMECDVIYSRLDHRRKWRRAAELAEMIFWMSKGNSRLFSDCTLFTYIVYILT